MGRSLRKPQARGSSPAGESISLPGESAVDLAILRKNLLAWYDANRRDLPWRHTRDPYAIWVSEIMLQQTRVAAVIDRYRDFLRNFPTVKALAHAAEEDVLALWSGLGYYRRARMMHKVAKLVTDEQKGKMPRTAAALRELPGIGAYTSAAIASIAFGEPAAVVDGNVERVIHRLSGWGSDSGFVRAELDRRTEETAQHLLDSTRPGDFNQAMMELGATVCLPRNPSCLVCPLRPVCKTRGEHATVPRAPMRSQSAAYALVIRNAPTSPDGIQGREILLDRRSAGQTVMPNMWELPALLNPDIPTHEVRLSVRHAIMQVNYYVRIRTVYEEDAEGLIIPSDTRTWVRLHDLPTLPLTGLARKVLLRSRLPELAPIPIVESAAG